MSQLPPVGSWAGDCMSMMVVVGRHQRPDLHLIMLTRCGVMWPRGYLHKTTTNIRPPSNVKIAPSWFILSEASTEPLIPSRTGCCGFLLFSIIFSANYLLIDTVPVQLYSFQLYKSRWMPLWQSKSQIKYLLTFGVKSWTVDISNQKTSI